MEQPKQWKHWIGCCLPVLCAILLGVSKSTYHVTAWSVGQWIPLLPTPLVAILPVNATSLTEAAWDYWEQQHSRDSLDPDNPSLLQIPVVEMADFATAQDVSLYLQATYGYDWRKRPLLLRGLNADAIHANPSVPHNGTFTDSSASSLSALSLPSSNRLSLEGLLRENLTVPYFTDSRTAGALSPDARAPIRDIVANMTRGAPHKIATQLLLQTHPELLAHVAPMEIVTELFGSFFTPRNIQGSGPLGLFPAWTTVPLFVARTEPMRAADTDTSPAVPFTALHCEPIGNIAVQLAGTKQWTLARPESTRWLQPLIAPDGRAFFASGARHPGARQHDARPTTARGVPVYMVDTSAGDALWVPPWTWHRVDYVASTSQTAAAASTAAPDAPIAIGASLFHFRPLEFVVNNPLLAVLIVPAILLELVGWKTQ